MNKRQKKPTKQKTLTITGKGAPLHHETVRVEPLGDGEFRLLVGRNSRHYSDYFDLTQKDASRLARFLDGSVTIRQFQQENVDRSRESFPSDGWTPLEWAGALAGEVGELANMLKKLRRGGVVDFSQEDIADEIGDVLAYLALVANSVDVDLETAACRKFNKVSRRVGDHRKLPVRG